MSEAGSVRSPRLTLSPALAGRVRVGTLLATPIVVTPTTETLDAEIESCGAGLRERFAGRPPAAIDDLAPARELYRTFGIDPTKTRPSSEKLLRRVLRGQSLPRISNADEAARLEAKLLKGRFDLDDLALQLGQMRRMGGIDGVMALLPGVAKAKREMAEAAIDDGQLRRQVAIIQSMTAAERKNARLLSGSRKRRVAAGSGTSTFLSPWRTKAKWPES